MDLISKFIAAQEAQHAKRKNKGKDGATPQETPVLAVQELHSAVPDSKEDNLSYNLADLTAFDISPVSSDQAKKPDQLLQISRDNCQLLINKLFTALPQESSDTGVVAILREHHDIPSDATSMRLPRHKPCPVKKELTRWEKFAQEKGIHKKKKSKMVWDETIGAWAPRWGYKSVKHNAEKAQWAIEVKEGADPFEDPFKKVKAEKKLDKAKQKMREMRNKVEAAGFKMNAATLSDTSRKNTGRGKEGLNEALKRAQTSSGSSGKFDRKAGGEVTVKKRGGKSKVNTAIRSKDEKAGYLKVLDRMDSKRGAMDTSKAVGFVQGEAEKKNRGAKKAAGGSSKGGGKRGGGKKGGVKKKGRK